MAEIFRDFKIDLPFSIKYLVLFLKIIWNNADALIANSKGLKKLAKDFYDKRQIDIIYNGVDTTKFYPTNITKTIQVIVRFYLSLALLSERDYNLLFQNYKKFKKNAIKISI